MSGSHPSRWLTFLVFGALTAFGCVGTTDTGQPSETGSLSVELVLAGGIEIDEVGWQITGNGMDMSGSIDVTAPRSTASVEVFGLPPGETDYTVMLTATSNDEQVTCEGSAPFNVEVGQSTDVMVMLNCKKPRTLGGVRVNGKFNICTELTKAVVSPLQTSVGNDISLSAHAFDEEGDAITYIWTGTGGAIADPSAASTTYTCQDVGEHTVMIMVTDNDVYCRMATWTIPVTCVEGDGGDLCEDVICEDDGNECTETACNPANGACETSNVADGTACDGGAGTCSGGQCVEVDLCEGVDCSDNNECTADACDPANGTCSNSNVENGTPCADDTGMCVDGSCVDVDLCEGVVCDDTGNECTVAMCNTTTGECDTMNVADGTACNGGVGACSAGVCIDDNPCEGVDCSSDNDCVQDGTCDPADGLCDPGDPQPADTACDLAGTDDGFCDGVGACVACNADAQCPDDGNECTAETCTSNACSSSPVADGTMCDDDMGVCDQGTCVPADLCEGVDCSDGNECTQDLCDPATGNCSNPAEPDGSQCTCPVCGAEGVCDMGVCIDPCDGVDCSDGNQCTADLCNVGVCSNPNVGPGAGCDQDGGNVCDGAGNCVECNDDTDCDAGESCVAGSCMAVAAACGLQSKVITVGCTNTVTSAQSPFPFELFVDVPVAVIGGSSFTADFDGIGTFPEFFLDAAQSTIPGGVQVAELVDFVATVQVRSGASGAGVELSVDIDSLVPGPTQFCTFPFEQTCTQDSDCVVAPCLPEVNLATVPNSTDCGAGGTCESLGKTGPGSQCALNGFCVTGDLVVDFVDGSGTYAADSTASEVLFGWDETGISFCSDNLNACTTNAQCAGGSDVCISNAAQLCPGATTFTGAPACLSDGASLADFPGRFDGCLALSDSVFSFPPEPNGIRLNASGLFVGIQCSMAEDGGECSTPGTCSVAGTSCGINDDCPTGETCQGVVGQGIGCLCDDIADASGNCASADCQSGETCVGAPGDDDVVCPTRDIALVSCPIN